MALFSYWTISFDLLWIIVGIITMLLHGIAAVGPYPFEFCSVFERFTYWPPPFFLAIVSIDQPPSRSWIPLQDTDRTRPAGETLSLQFRLCYTDLNCIGCSFTSPLPWCSNLDNSFQMIKRNILRALPLLRETYGCTINQINLNLGWCVLQLSRKMLRFD